MPGSSVSSKEQKVIQRNAPHLSSPQDLGSPLQSLTYPSKNIRNKKWAQNTRKTYLSGLRYHCFRCSCDSALRRHPVSKDSFSFSKICSPDASPFVLLSCPSAAASVGVSFEVMASMSKGIESDGETLEELAGSAMADIPWVVGDDNVTVQKGCSASSRLMLSSSTSVHKHPKTEFSRHATFLIWLLRH